MLTQMEHEYRHNAVRSARPTALVIMLYDTLINDLQRAIEAVNEADIELRSAELNHALLVLQQLEGSLDREKGGKLVQSLTRFYQTVRAGIIEAAARSDAKPLARNIELVCDVRQVWQQKDAELAEQAGHGPVGDSPSLTPYGTSAAETTAVCNWSA